MNVSVKGNINNSQIVTGNGNNMIVQQQVNTSGGLFNSGIITTKSSTPNYNWQTGEGNIVKQLSLLDYTCKITRTIDYFEAVVIEHGLSSDLTVLAVKTAKLSQAMYFVETYFDIIL